MSKKMKIIFTLSFLLNIIVLGVLLGGLYKINRDHHPYAVSETTREIMKKNMRADRQEMRENFNEIRKYKKDLKGIVTAEEFDRKAYDVKINQILTIKNTISQRKAKTLGETLSTLSQEERAAFLPHMMGQLLNRPPKGGKRHMDRNPMNIKDK